MNEYFHYSHIIVEIYWKKIYI